MAINTSKVIVGGLIGGVVANAIDFALNGFVLANMQKAALDALNPTLAANAMQASKIPIFVALDFVWIIANVWIYAAIRPRFGPGARTAVYAGVASWVVGSVVAGYFAAMGMFSWNLYSISGLCALLNSVVSTVVGAKFYTEETAAQGVGQTAYSA
jgi:hypothetical protein